MGERDAFLKALAENEDDNLTRSVYADWLDDHGEYDEAERQRQWPAAKAWLVRFCREIDEEGSEEEIDEGNPYSYIGITYAKLVRLGHKAVEEADEGRVVLDCGANQDLADALRANAREFWRCWSAVTGVPVPAAAEGKSFFGCSC